MVYYKMLIHIFCHVSPILAQITLDSSWFLYRHILGSYVMNIYHCELFNSLPCSDSKSHSLQEKSSLTLLQVDKIFHITIITIHLLITHVPSSCPGAHIFNCVYYNLKFVDVKPHHIFKYLRLQASRLSKYLAGQNTFKKLFLPQIGKLLGKIFLTARLY
jgi:hypothetical protein